MLAGPAGEQERSAYFGQVHPRVYLAMSDKLPPWVLKRLGQYQEEEFPLGRAKLCGSRQECGSLANSLPANHLRRSWRCGSQAIRVCAANSVAMVAKDLNPPAASLSGWWTRARKLLPGNRRKGMSTHCTSDARHLEHLEGAHLFNGEALVASDLASTPREARNRSLGAMPGLNI
jgi:hypothetical protein